jgi:hypothetical protein
MYIYARFFENEPVTTPLHMSSVQPGELKEVGGGHYGQPGGGAAPPSFPGFPFLGQLPPASFLHPALEVSSIGTTVPLLHFWMETVNLED